MKEKADKTAKTQEILDGLTGVYRLGQKYYIFTVTYAYIGTIAKMTDDYFVLEPCDIVSRAGSAVDAVTQIVNGKTKPEAYESVGKPVIIHRQAIVTGIPCA